MEHEIPFGNSNRENWTTFLDFPLFLGTFQWDEPTKRVPFTAEPELPEILSKWKAPLVSPPSSPSDRGRQGYEKLRNKQSIHHFHIDHNLPCLAPPKLCITIVFDFSWDDCNTLENLETLVMQNSEGENKVHHGLYESSDYKRCKACVN